ncbi:MAG: hypothetical protein KC454_03370 [Flavobacteriales bacterium]|nr:hypothetical protein [Flavobacteriales bacterium]
MFNSRNNLRMRSKMILGILVFSSSVFVGCTPGKEIEDVSSSAVQLEELVPEEVAEDPLYGSYQLSDMIPFTDGKKLTSQDEKYIADSKGRTLGKTKLTLKNDGTFERVFPHPSGDGSINTWTGTYSLDEEAGTLNMVAEMNGKSMPIDFTIVEKVEGKLSLKSSFGQIFMIYVYTK